MAQGRHNNFDLLRLLAATQVLIQHSFSHLGLSIQTAISEALSAFPGVPIFFVISGFLVSESFERCTLPQYALNRALRIFPGLWACLAVSIFIACVWGDVSVGGTWIAAQMTVVQFYNPDYLRQFGTGVLNGSLWTIPVELQFYVALPLVLWALKSNKALLTAIGIGAILNVAYFAWGQTSPLQKLVGITLPVYLYVFLIGVALQKNRDFVTRVLVGRAPMWLAIYIAVELAARAAGIQAVGNLMNPISLTALAMLVISAAFARPIPLKSDLSYGIYLYHMPVVNAFIQRDARSYLNVFEAACITLALAAASWLLVERPALKLKRHFSAFGKRALTPITRVRIASS